jgi:hypothetical protein
MVHEGAAKAGAAGVAAAQECSDGMGIEEAPVVGLRQRPADLMGCGR